MNFFKPIEKYFQNKNKLVLISTLLLIWIELIIMAPLLASSPKPYLNKIGEWIYFFYQPTCHQIAERSFLLNGIPMAVCIRCFSFYIGGLIIIILYFLKKTVSEINLKWIIFLSIPVLLDFIMEKLSFYENVVAVRFMTGLFLGGCVSYLVLFSLAQVTRKKNKVTVL